MIPVLLQQVESERANFDAQKLANYKDTNFQGALISLYSAFFLVLDSHYFF